MDAVNELQRICESGVNFSIARLDSGFDVKLGSYVKGSQVEGLFTTFEEAIAWLGRQVKFGYPDCSYAKALIRN